MVLIASVIMLGYPVLEPLYSSWTTPQGSCISRNHITIHYYKQWSIYKGSRDTRTVYLVIYFITLAFMPSLI